MPSPCHSFFFLSSQNHHYSCDFKLYRVNTKKQTFFTPSKKSHRMIKLYCRERKRKKTIQAILNKHLKVPNKLSRSVRANRIFAIEWCSLGGKHEWYCITDTCTISSNYSNRIKLHADIRTLFKNEIKIKWAGGWSKRWKKKRGSANQSKSAKHSRVVLKEAYTAANVKGKYAKWKSAIYINGLQFGIFIFHIGDDSLRSPCNIYIVLLWFLCFMCTFYCWLVVCLAKARTGNKQRLLLLLFCFVLDVMISLNHKR